MIDDSLGLSFIAGKLTFDTQIYWGMSVVIRDDLFYTQWASFRKMDRCLISK